MTTKLTPEDNIKIWLDTKKKCYEFQYPYAESILYNHLRLTPHPQYEKTNIQVVENDTFSCCEELSHNCVLNVVGLNMANHKYPGGGVESGAYAQEENCFRRSNYFMFLKSSLYPIPETSCIYTPLISIIKDRNYQPLKVPITLSMIACAALRDPKVTEQDTYLDPQDRALMKDKISQIFQVGYQQKKDTLILGAFGCGAFHNPPNEVAHLFNQVIQLYDRCFKLLIFAIKGGGQHDHNYQVFSQIIKTTY